jgi:hypothetical protein
MNQGTGVVGIYLIYRSAMSLSPIGKIGWDVESSALSQQTNQIKLDIELDRLQDRPIVAVEMFPR